MKHPKRTAFLFALFGCCALFAAVMMFLETRASFPHEPLSVTWPGLIFLPGFEILCAGVAGFAARYTLRGPR